MIFCFFQLSTLFILLLCVSLKINSKFLKILSSLIAGLFVSLEALAFYLTNRFADYQFYLHADLESVKEFGGLFIYQTIFFIALIALISISFYKILKFLAKKFSHIRYIYILLIIISCFAILSVQNGIFREFYDTYKILNSKTGDFDIALEELGIPQNKYVFRNQIKAKPGKNIIVISAESLEQGYFDFKDLMPNLKNLKEKWTFLDMDQGVGSTWTSGSFYTYQTGFPMLFSVSGSETLQGAISSKITGLTDVLRKAGYNIKYIMGRPEHAGIKDLMEIYNINSISEKNAILNKNKKWDWGDKSLNNYGLNDFDTFAETKIQIDNALKTKAPFAIFLSTINSHFPNGIYDKRMEKYVAKKDSDLEFCVASVDYLVADLVNFLKNKGSLENTSIFIFPDHLLMGSKNMTSVHKKLNSKERKLYLLTNAKSNALPSDIKKPIQQIDLPKLILAGAGVKTNAKFLSDFIEGDKKDFIKNNLKKIIAVNNASLENKNILSGIKIVLKNDKLNVISNDGYSEYIKINNEIKLVSSEFNTSKKYPSKIQIGTKSFKPGRGLNLVIFDNKISFKNYDTWKDENELSKFIKDIDKAKNKKFIVVAHDAIKKSNKKLDDELSNLGFKKLSKISGRAAYIATNMGEKGKLTELDANKTTSLKLKNTISSLNDGYYVFKLSTRGFVLSKFRTNYRNSGNIDSPFKIIVVIKNGKILQAYLGNNDKIGLTKSGENIEFSSNEIHSILASKNLNKIDNVGSNFIEILVSNNISYSNLDSYVKVNGSKIKGNCKNCLNLLTKQKGKITLNTYFKNDKTAIANFVKELKNIRDNNQSFVLFSENLKNDYIKNYEKELNELGFKDLIHIKDSTAYLSHNADKTKITEITSKQFINIGINIFDDDEFDVKTANAISNKIKN